MNHYVKAIIILTLTTNLSAADTQSKSRKELVDGFRASQVCYEEAVSSKNWAQGLICASSSLNSGIEIFGQEHRNIAALTHNDGLMLMKVRENFVDIMCKVNPEHLKNVVNENGKKFLYMEIL